MEEKNENPQASENSESQAEQNTGAEEPENVQKDQISEEIGKEARMWAMFCHLAGLGAFVIPLVGNIVAPLVLWQLKKNEYPFVDEQGKEALNFQISVTIYAIASLFLFVICIGPFLLAAVGIFDFVLLLIAAVKANDGGHYHYPLAIRFIK